MTLSWRTLVTVFLSRPPGGTAPVLSLVEAMVEAVVEAVVDAVVEAVGYGR